MEQLSTCPWSSFASGDLITCEARLCEWVRQPLNTISSLAYFVAALVLWKLWRQYKSPFHRDFGYFAFAIGVASILAHAAQVRVMVFLDYSFQSFLFVYLLAKNFRRLGIVSGSKAEAAIFFLGVCLVIFMHLANSRSGPLAAGLPLTLLMGSEIYLINQLTQAQKKLLLRTCTILGVGAIFFTLDATKLVCAPNNHWFQLHAIWHCLTAICLVTAANYYSALIFPNSGQKIVSA